MRPEAVEHAAAAFFFLTIGRVHDEEAWCTWRALPPRLRDVYRRAVLGMLKGMLKVDDDVAHLAHLDEMDMLRERERRNGEGEAHRA